MTRLKHLIFDLDGTLIDSSDGVVAAVNYSLEKMGQPTQKPETIKRYIGYPLFQMYPDFTDAPVDELYRHFQVKAAETVVSSTTRLPGAQEVIDAARARGLRLAIATTKIKAHLTGIMEMFDWQDVFAAATGGDEVERVKPAPDAFRLTLERLGALAEDSMVVGDTVNDVRAAQGAGVEVAAVVSPYGRREELKASRPDHFLEKLTDLLPLLDARNGSGR